MPNHNIDDFFDAIRHAAEQNTTTLIKHLQNPTTIYFCDSEERTCEVCGEPINELSRHICDKCFAAAKKYKNALTDREVAFGG